MTVLAVWAAALVIIAAIIVYIGADEMGYLEDFEGETDPDNADFDVWAWNIRFNMESAA